MHGDGDRPQMSHHEPTARWRPGVSTRLLGAIAVPVVVLALLLGATVRQSHRNVEQARAVSTVVTVLDQLVALRAAVFKERVAAEIFVPSRRPPVQLLAATEFGAQLSERPEEMVEATDSALAALAPADRPFDQADLERARAEQPTESEGEPARLQGFALLDEQSERAITEGLTFVRETAIELGDVEMIRAGTVFQRSVELPGEAGLVIAETADLWVAPPSQRPELQSRLAMAVATYEASSRRYASAAGSRTADELRADQVLEMPPALRTAVDLGLAGELTGAARPAGEPPTIGIGLLAGVDWILEVNALPSRLAASAQTTAREVADGALTTEQRTAAFALAAVSVSIAAAVLFGRSIVGPVRRLTDHAERIGSGQLEPDARAWHGPPEIVRASQAMNDMVDNLVLLERKSNALAQADFDDPALQRQLPGRLGASLQLSMETLSNSVAQREALQEQLQHDALHDSLTGLGNRAALISMLSRVQHDDGDATTVAVIFIDLDDFKGINDRYGHAAGDDVLRVAAARMLSVVPARALVTRLGGDEFVIALSEVDGIDEPIEVARRVTRSLGHPVEIGGSTIEMRASAGVAISGHGSGETGVEALLRMADFAVYSVKLDPNEDIAIYDEALHQRLIHQREVEEALRTALHPESAELRLVFQPIVLSSDYTLRGVEALLRWSTAHGGTIAPDEFIPIAERSDLILDVDQWVLERALRHLRDWTDDASIGAIGMSVNVSGRSLLDRTFVERVGDALLASGIDASRLRLEVTETAIVEDLDLVAVHLAQLQALGVRVVIDDFGTGYTSVAHLRALPVDEIKIDGSFVQGLEDDENRVLVEMIVQLARQLDVPTVAEGVETVEQAEQLREIGCTSLQGYLFSRPVEAECVAEWGGRPVLHV